MYKPDIVIHHAPCDDGWTAAMCVYRYCKEDAKMETMPEFIEGNYSNKDIDYWIDKVRDKNVLVVDFSFKGAIRKAMETACKSMLILDHHASAKQEYGDDVISFENKSFVDAPALLEANKIVILMADDKCGSSMAWEFFFPDQDRPEFIDYIEDQDLGKRKLKDATAFTYWLRSQKAYRDPKNYEFLFTFDEEEPYQRAMEEGKTIYRFVEFNLSQAADWAAVGKVEVEGIDRELNIAIAFAPYQFASELANIMVAQRKVDAALVFYSGGDLKTGVSIRGSKTEAGLNTNYARLMAESLGGGGHDMASGANWGSYTELTKLIAEITETWK